MAIYVHISYICVFMFIYIYIYTHLYVCMYSSDTIKRHISLGRYKLIRLFSEIKRCFFLKFFLAIIFDLVILFLGTWLKNNLKYTKGFVYYNSNNNLLCAGYFANYFKCIFTEWSNWLLFSTFCKLIKYVREVRAMPRHRECVSREVRITA
jgi:hypothetical protein